MWSVVGACECDVDVDGYVGFVDVEVAYGVWSASVEVDAVVFDVVCFDAVELDADELYGVGEFAGSAVDDDGDYASAYYDDSVAVDGFAATDDATWYTVSEFAWYEAAVFDFEGVLSGSVPDVLSAAGDAADGDEAATDDDGVDEADECAC